MYCAANAIAVTYFIVNCKYNPDTHCHIYPISVAGPVSEPDTVQRRFPVIVTDFIANAISDADTLAVCFVECYPDTHADRHCEQRRDGSPARRWPQDRVC